MELRSLSRSRISAARPLGWAIDNPVNLTDLVLMVLLADTIFTITLVLRRKEAAHGLAVGLTTLTIALARAAARGRAPAARVARLPSEL